MAPPELQHKVEGSTLASWPPHRRGLANALSRAKLVTDTYDTVRFPGTGQLPISLFFEDGLNFAHEVTVEHRQSEPLQLLLPLPLGHSQHLGNDYRCLIWHGTDLKERTLVSPNAALAVCTFTYTSGRPVPLVEGCAPAAAIPHTHGIRIHVQAYGLPETFTFNQPWTFVRWTAYLKRAGLGPEETSKSLQLPSAAVAPVTVEEHLECVVAARRQARDGVSNLNVHLALLLTQFCWGSAAVVNKLGLSGAGMNPLLFALIREMCAAPLLLLLLAFIRGQLCPWSGWAPASPLIDIGELSPDLRPRVDYSRRPSITQIVVDIEEVPPQPGSNRITPTRGPPTLGTPASVSSLTRAVTDPGTEDLSPDHRPRRKILRNVLRRFLPGVFIFVDQFCSLTGVKLASPTSAAAWQPSQMIFTLCISVCIGAESLTQRKAAGVVLVFCGAAWLVVFGGQHSSEESPGTHPQLGQLLFFINCLAASLEVILWRSLLRNSRSPLGHFAVMAESYLMAALLMSFACIFVSSKPWAVDLICPECEGDPWHLPGDALYAIAYSVIFQTIVGYCAQAWALRYAESSLVALYATMQPIFATTISCGLLSVGLDPSGALTWPGKEAGGAILIILGLIVTVPGACRSLCRPVQPKPKPRAAPSALTVPLLAGEAKLAA